MRLAGLGVGPGGARTYQSLFEPAVVARSVAASILTGDNHFASRRRRRIAPCRCRHLGDFCRHAFDCHVVDDVCAAWFRIEADHFRLAAQATAALSVRRSGSRTAQILPSGTATATSFPGSGPTYAPEDRRAVASISILMRGSARPATIMVAAGRIAPNARFSAGQHAGKSSAEGRM